MEYEQKSEEEFYAETTIHDLMDNDEISAGEEAFMIGYMGC